MTAQLDTTTADLVGQPSRLPSVPRASRLRRFLIRFAGGTPARRIAGGDACATIWRVVCAAWLAAFGFAFAAETNAPRPELQISADFGRFQLKEKIAFYSNNVVVVDPPAKPGDEPTIIRCRELTATQDTNGRLATIVAFGQVQIDQGDTHARADRVVYYGTNETMVLTGGFDAQNPRPYLYSSQFTNYGDEIVYDRVADTLYTRNVRTDISGSTLKSGTNDTNKSRAPGLFGPRKK